MDQNFAESALADVVLTDRLEKKYDFGVAAQCGGVNAHNPVVAVAPLDFVSAASRLRGIIKPHATIAKP